MKWYKIDELTLKELLHDHFKLIALENGNVSTWGGYYYALDEFLLASGQEDFYDVADRAIMTQYKNKIIH